MFIDSFEHNDKVGFKNIIYFLSHVCQIKKFNKLFRKTIEQESQEVNPFEEFFIKLPKCNLLKEIIEEETKQNLIGFDSTLFRCNLFLLNLASESKILRQELQNYKLLDTLCR